MARAIMISDHVYKELSEMKVEGQSYTQVIDRLIHKKQKKKDWRGFAGAWGFLSEKRAKEIEEVAKKVRKNWRKVPEW